jgi:hypothetical protein
MSAGGEIGFLDMGRRIETLHLESQPVQAARQKISNLETVDAGVLQVEIAKVYT